jgi:acyl-CoA reductase-like NAD-dependent aldehyde dehydrogenase
MHIAKNYINNQWVATENKLDIQSPKDGKVIGVCCSGEGLVDQAVESAQIAFQAWRQRTVKDRVQILFKFHHLVELNKGKLAELIMLEHGKTESEALAEIAKGNETVEYAISLPQLIGGRILQVSRGVNCQDVRKPHGVVVSVVPFSDAALI